MRQPESLRVGSLPLLSVTQAPSSCGSPRDSSAWASRGKKMGRGVITEKEIPLQKAPHSSSSNSEKWDRFPLFDKEVETSAGGGPCPRLHYFTRGRCTLKHTCLIPKLDDLALPTLELIGVKIKNGGLVCRCRVIYVSSGGFLSYQCRSLLVTQRLLSRFKKNFFSA